MRKVLLGKKEGMTRIYNQNEAVPVTVIESPDCVLVNKGEKNGRTAVQLGLERTDKVNKPEAGQFESRGISPRKIIREFPVSPESPLLDRDIGDDVSPTLFDVGELVDVVGVTKGRGFQGVVKRWDFSGGTKSHGAGLGRGTGAVGQAADPSRVFPGQKMPGHYGGDRKTVQNLTVEKVIEDRNLLLVSGSVPGSEGGTVVIHSASKGDNNGS